MLKQFFTTPARKFSYQLEPLFCRKNSSKPFFVAKFAGCCHISPFCYIPPALYNSNSSVSYQGKMSDSLLNVVFVLGKPGSGKGTQCEKLIKEFSKCRHLSAGDLLREKRKEGDDVGEMIENYIKEGKIVPVEITIALIKEAMEKLQASVNGADRLLFLIDGFPRNDDNLQGWQKQMNQVAVVHNVLFFNISDEVATERCLARGASGSGRVDDNTASITKRLNTYKDTAAIIEYYRGLCKVTELKGEETVDEVFEKVRAAISNIFERCR